MQGWERAIYAIGHIRTKTMSVRKKEEKGKTEEDQKVSEQLRPIKKHWPYS